MLKRDVQPPPAKTTTITITTTTTMTMATTAVHHRQYGCVTLLELLSLYGPLDN
jgi:hypothetical protein